MNSSGNFEMTYEQETDVFCMATVYPYIHSESMFSLLYFL